MVHSKLPIAKLALAIADTICLNTEECVSEFIKVNGVLALRCVVMQTAYESLTSKVCLVLANIMVGPVEHIQEVLNANFISTLANLAMKNVDYKVRREATWAIANGCIKGSQYQKLRIVKEGGLNAFIFMLDTKETGLLLIVLEAIEKLLEQDRKTDEESKVKELFEDLGGINKLEELQLHESEEVYKKVVTILEQNFKLEETTNPNEERKLNCCSLELVAYWH
eukprot:TRINITY_DN8804_c0_g5_i3.p2 TRINITY_DN8804_c0_g5~~TRINITY_DN8804_c0_g5_i3.p2  ORF type:complete len:224 (-),score=56.02 TRINITY_DN8804_c0_g5_i3:42-713(-)